MDKTYFTDQVYEKKALSAFEKGEYENCKFIDCDFSQGNLAAFSFMDCHFINCNLSSAKISKTAFKSVVFKHCKLLGLRFDAANPFLFAINLESCMADFCSFYGLKLKNCLFKDVSLKESDFSSCDLSGIKFDNCNLDRAMFENSVLEKSDFSNAYHFLIDPENNKLKGAKFNLAGLPGLLQKYEIVVV
jgi:fluoroquinolone resistance protein